MRRTKPQAVRNKIDLADHAQRRVWTKRLVITSGDLKRMIGKVGNSIAAVSKEIELQRAHPLPKPSSPIQMDPASLPAQTVVAEVHLMAADS
jgi:uncharacterized protein DUF3606